MTREFIDEWKAKVQEKNSVLCAGVDPAEYEMGRGEKGLPEGVDKLEWSLKYIEAVAPYCAAVKPNTNYWEDIGDMQALMEITSYAHGLGLLVIEDSKRRDIGASNDAGFYYGHLKVFDAVTFNPFAGNLEEAVEQADDLSLGLISMCLMSNPEFEKVKNNFPPVDLNEYDLDTLDKADYFGEGASGHVKKYIELAHDAEKAGADGIVIGAPSSGNHISEREIKKVSKQFSGLILVPGVGAQGGDAEKIFNHFDSDQIIVNVGRGLMLPNGSNSTGVHQRNKALEYTNMLNRLRVS
jgi:orotidine-5'-phosphate decarboxylase